MPLSSALQTDHALPNGLQPISAPRPTLSRAGAVSRGAIAAGAAAASMWLFVSLLIGAFVASLAATAGGRCRDA